MGSVLVAARFAETENGISYNSFDATQIDSYPTMRKKQLHLMRRFGHLLRRKIRTRTHGEMVITTEINFDGDGVFVDSRQALILL